MQCQVLASGSGGNATLVRAGELSLLVDAGLKPQDMRERLATTGLPFKGLDHVLVPHGHLDHARSAGVISRKHDATLHCPAAMLTNRSVCRAPRQVAIEIGRARTIVGRGGASLTYRPVALPHDCHPTVAYHLEHAGGVAVILTDMGRPDAAVARSLRGAHVLVLEFNHDRELLEAGDDPEALKRRIGGDQGHLSNEQAARMLAGLVGPQLHTLVLAHLSARNNTPERALAAARGVLAELGREDVTVLVAGQDEPGPTIRVS
ncbi:MAG: MBL fold metallo-hydrolase [Planctomycetota bacterium]|nr:MBL fold metallo-hydrolase [Planctomycetota bacterium]